MFGSKDNNPFKDGTEDGNATATPDDGKVDAGQQASVGMTTPEADAGIGAVARSNKGGRGTSSGKKAQPRTMAQIDLGLKRSLDGLQNRLAVLTDAVNKVVAGAADAPLPGVVGRAARETQAFYGQASDLRSQQAAAQQRLVAEQAATQQREAEATVSSLLRNAFARADRPIDVEALQSVVARLHDKDLKPAEIIAELARAVEEPRS